MIVQVNGICRQMSDLCQKPNQVTELLCILLPFLLVAYCKQVVNALSKCRNFEFNAAKLHLVTGLFPDTLGELK